MKGPKAIGGADERSNTAETPSEAIEHAWQKNGGEETSVTHKWLAVLWAPVAMCLPAPARAVSSAELYQNETYTYGRFEARIRFAAGDGVISSFFLWKPGSEMAGAFWNELDFEKLGADCRLQTNPLYGAPVVDHSQAAAVEGDLCAEYHTYAFEWTPTYIAYLVDGIEVRRDIDEAAMAFAVNAAGGMQIHFNVWPGDATFGGNFDPASLPVQQYMSWVQYSSFSDGAFTLEWREDFTGGALPSGWSVGNWPSPKNLSTHSPANVGFVSEVSVLSLTADDALGFSGEPPIDDEASSTNGGNGGSEPTMGQSTGGSPTSVGSGGAGGSGPASGPNSGGASAGTTASGGAGGGPALSNDPARSSGSDGNCSYGTSRVRRSGGGIGVLALGFVALFALRRRGARSITKQKPSH
jgi:hypothetical protein